jgi:preprotein translocase subunit SecB
MTMPEAKAQNSTEYQEFIADLDMYYLALSEASCKINREAFWEKDSEHRIAYNLKSKPVCVESKSFDVRCVFTLAMTGEKSKSPVVNVVAEFDVSFHSSKPKKEFVEEFCKSEIRLLVIPYCREFVTDLTARMHIPPLILPLSTKMGAK